MIRIAKYLRQRFDRTGAILAAGLLLSCHGRAEEIKHADRQYFEQKVRPVLAEHCYECHSAMAKKLKGGLLLDTRAGVLEGGDSGEPAIIPGQPYESLLIKAIRHEEDYEMPPKKPKLPDAVINDLATWIKMGAPDPRDASSTDANRADKATWWSLQPLAQPAIPNPAGLPAMWEQNAIDRFVFAKLAEEKLQPNPPADPRTLVRRMAYDMTGLPASPQDVDAFVQAYRTDSESATLALIERLLASPHYGEQWGRHWLDVVRFGESTGFERNSIVNNAWPFRDYIIRSLNEDRPFDRLIIEHLAGDVIGKDDPAVEVGTTFLVAGAYDNVGNGNPVALANIRAVTIDDIITATGGAFLGLTLNCARCHNHKFDPIPTEDYYRVRAAFEGVKHGEREIATPEDRQRYHELTAPLEAERKRLVTERTAIEKAVGGRDDPSPPNPAALRSAPDPMGTEERFAPVRARFVRLKILATATNVKTGVGARLDEFEIWSAGPMPRNVALATAGARATGATRVAEDFVVAYDPSQVIDGQDGAHWIAGNPPELTITLAHEEAIDRILFSYDRATALLQRRTPYPVEFEILASTDGSIWTRIADSSDRAAATEDLAAARRFNRTVHPVEKARLAALSEELAQVEKQLSGIKPLPTVWAGKFEVPAEPTRVQKGGDPMKPGDVVTPSSLSVLDRVTTPYSLPADAPESQRRLALGEWIASYGNPLTARVLANRVWHYHFGTGLVDTPSDFGFLGSKPTHPELLDFLARRLHTHGWKLKALHREILRSQTYRQAGTLRADAAAMDKDARWFWRFPPRRLSAEELRDTMLAVAGRLNLTAGGPGFRLYRHVQDNVCTYFPLDVHGPETYRRAVYHQNARASVIDVLSDFDLPDSALPAPRRTLTTTPLQTLTLFNHRFTLDLAEALANRMEGRDAAAVRRAYGFAFQRAPTPRESEAALALVARHGARAFCRALLNSNELLHVE